MKNKIITKENCIKVFLKSIYDRLSPICPLELKERRKQLSINLVFLNGLRLGFYIRLQRNIYFKYREHTIKDSGRTFNLPPLEAFSTVGDCVIFILLT